MALQCKPAVAARFLLLLLAAPAARLATAWMEEGFTDGVDGDRYSMWQDEPKAEDNRETQKAGEDIKCDVCGVILADLLGKVGSGSDEDRVLDLLEGEPDENEVEEAVAKRDKNLVKLARGRKGCNRHFKDSYFRLGWDVEGCTVPPPPGVEKPPPFKTVYGTCVTSGQPVQNETKMNTYSRRMEAVYWACELTVGRHKEAIASFVAKRLTKGGASLEAIAKEACEAKGKCKRRQYQGTYEDREKDAEKAYFNQQKSVLDSVMKDQKQKKKAEKKSKQEATKKSGEL